MFYPDEAQKPAIQAELVAMKRLKYKPNYLVLTVYHCGIVKGYEVYRATIKVVNGKKKQGRANRTVWNERDYDRAWRLADYLNDLAREEWSKRS